MKINRQKVYSCCYGYNMDGFIPYGKLIIDDDTIVYTCNKFIIGSNIDNPGYFYVYSNIKITDFTEIKKIIDIARIW